MSFPMTFHVAPFAATGAHSLDDPSNLPCRDCSHQHPLDSWRLDLHGCYLPLPCPRMICMRASDLPAAAPHTASQHPISLSSIRPATCSSIERSEVPRCPPNGPTIDGKDGVRQSAVRPAPAGPTAAVSRSATGGPDTADPRSWRSRHSSTAAEGCHEAACQDHDQPSQHTALQLLQRCRLPNQRAPARALVITDEASPFALRSTRNSFRGEQCTKGAFARANDGEEGAAGWWPTSPSSR
jgi:hypothetical protein